MTAVQPNQVLLCAGLYGKSNEEALRIDEVMQIIVDIRTALMNAHFEKDPAKKVHSGP